MTGLTDMLNFGDADMLRMLGEPVTLSRAATPYAERVAAIIDREASTVELEVGGAVVQYGGKARVPKAGLPYPPRPQDTLTDSTGKRYNVMRVLDAPNDTSYHLELTQHVRR